MNLSSNPKIISKKNIIFDFDGVIFTLDWNYGEDLNMYRKRIRQSVATEIDPELPSQIDKSQPSYVLTDLAIEKHGEKAKEIIFQLYKDKEETLLETAIPHIDTIEFIKKNKDKYKYFIWSNNQSSTIESLLVRAGIENYFEIIVARNDFKLSKPDPGGFDLIFNPETHEKSEFVMIGDSLTSDKIAAQKVGIDFIHYS